MKIFLYLSNKIFDYTLPDEISGSFSFDPNEDDNKLINIEARDGNWIIYATSYVKLLKDNNEIKEDVLELEKYYILEKENKKYLLYIKRNCLDGILAFKYDDSLNITISSNTNNSIVYNCSYFSNSIVSIYKQNGIINVLTKGNNLTYINKNYQVSEQTTLDYGDELDLLGLKIIFLKEFFLILNHKNIIINDSNLLANKFEFPKLSQNEDIDIKEMELYKKDDYFFKSPRIRRSIEEKDIELSKPPKTNLDEELPMILTVGPMLTMGLISVVTLTNTILRVILKQATWSDSWSSLVTSGVMLVSMLVWPIVTKTYHKYHKKKKLQEGIDKYLLYLDSKKEILNQEQTLQKSILLENLITIDECLKIIEQKNLNFWDKRIDQNDFLTLRIGVGDSPLKVNFNYSKEDFAIEENAIKEKVESLIEEYKNLKNVPIGYSFYENKITAIMGNKYKTTNFLHNIILQLLTFYSYEDIKLVFFTNKNNEKEWEYLKYLNHTFNNEKSFRYFASDSESAKNVSEYLDFEINERINSIKNGNEGIKKPHYIIMTDDYEKIKRYSFVEHLTETEENLGFSMIILENRLGNLPSKCNNFINLGSKNSGVLKNAYENQEQIAFVDEIHYNIDMMEISKKLSNIPIEFENDLNKLADTITFLEMEKVGKIEQLNILNRWNSNDCTQSLKAEVGVDELGDLMYLDLHEKHHGPHGLIAGMTGSGKSEFIITYILSMAINYSPDYVSFILIDYKGGGLAFAFENKLTGVTLPHLAGTITNLDKAEMDRTLVSIDSEIKRRQEIFNKAREQLSESTMDIYKYQRHYKEGRLEEAIPHLFIICDEFAELKSQQPEFMDNLISVARIGRSLGVHLILATQKPSGVVNDQIWSNTRFRVCLKVQDENDSREVLKRTEAAYLKQVGRFYLQVGFDEYFALGQSAWCGAKYYPSEKIVKQVDKSINFINDNGYFIKSVEASNGIKIAPQGEQLAAIIKSVIDISNKVGKKSKRLWLDNIPDIILESDLAREYNQVKTPFNVKAIVGKYDAPEIQKQGLVEYDFLNDGNTIIYGINGIEKEMLLNEIIYSSTKNYSVEELNYYIIDYGSESLGRWINLPHVGGVVYSSETEEFINLFKLIKEELQRRKKLFANFGGDYKNYIRLQKTLPLKVVVINDYDSVYETYPELYDELPEIVRDSSRYGIIFILTANAINSVQNKIAQNFSNIYVLKLKDSSDYSSIFNARTKLIPRENLGRGLLNNDGIHEFQVASIVEDESKLNEFIQDFIKNQKSINENKAKNVPLLPEVVTYNDVKEKLKGIESVPIGISKDELEVMTMDYLDTLGNIVTSMKIENTKNFVLSLLGMLNIIPNIKLYVLDSLNLLMLDKNVFTNYYNDNFDNIIEELTNNIGNYKTNNGEEKGIIIINGISKLLSKLEDSNKLSELFNIIKEYEKFGVIIVDEASKIKNIMYESWFSSIFDVTNGLWIGRGITDQSLLRLSNITKEMSKDYKNDMGYLIQDGTSTLCKLIDFVNQEGKSYEE